jgi:DNA helicase-2/ATP-dependent DNA helicase PcrA
LNTEIAFGPPGTGKTQYLLETAERYLAGGISPEQLAFVSFSKRAVNEAITRMCERFPGTSGDSFPYFRTIHSLGFYLKGFRPGHLLNTEELREFGQQYHYSFNGFLPEDKVNWGGTPEDRALATHLVHRARCVGTLFDQWSNTGGVKWSLVERLVPEYERFKETNDLVDFADMIDLTKPYAPAKLNAKVLIVDEAQDTSLAQWKFLRYVSQNVEHVHLAGDDDQTIYEWNGADGLQLLRFSGNRLVLPLSHRLPVAIKALADRIASRISVRIPKQYQSRAGQGHVETVKDTDQISLLQGSWLLLARTHRQLFDLRSWARREGVVYTLPNGNWSWSEDCVQAPIYYEKLRRGEAISPRHAKLVKKYLPDQQEVPQQDHYKWHDLCNGINKEVTWMEALTRMAPADREYVRELRLHKESLHEPGRIRIGTVHSMKGAEADNVALLTETSHRVYDEARRNPDAELRVQYVATTRARENLYLLNGKSIYYWQF